MTINSVTQVSLLSWAIGAPLLIDENDPITTPDLLKLFKDHRIAGRALARIAAQRPSWASQELVDGLTQQQEENQWIITQQAAALAELRREYIAAEQPMILFKGLGAYAHSRDSRSLRRTLDVDIILLHPHPIAEKMRKDGLEEYRNVSPHEIINARLKGVEIDLHGFYPIWSFDRNIGPVALNARDGITVREHAGGLVVSELGPDLLLDNALRTDLFGVPDVFFPDPAAATLIICAHGFRDYVSKSSVTARNKPPLRFAEIAEVAEYVHMPQFDKKRFLELMERTHAHDAVEWMAHVVARYAHDQSLLDVLASNETGLTNGRHAPYIGTPQAVWTGFWEILHRDMGDEVCRHMSTHEVIERLGPCVVPSSNKTARIELDDACQTAGLARPSTIHIRRSGPLPMAVQLQHDGAELMIRAQVACRDACTSRRFHVDIQGQSFEWQCRADKQYWKKSEGFPPPTVDWRVREGDYELQLRVPAPPAERSHYGQCVPVVIAAGEFDQGFDIRRGTLLPVMFQLSPAEGASAN